MKIATFAPGRTGQIAGYQFTAKRETSIELTRSDKTGNALINVVGDVQVRDVVGKFDVDIKAAAYDIGTKDWEAQGSTSLLGALGPRVHLKGNNDGATGACIFFICFPLSPGKPTEKGTGP